MGWKENLRPGSFRGVPFQAQDHSGNGGRRGTLHEYPQKDEPLFEDLGRKARDNSITVFVIGEEYMTARDALIEALEAPSPGELVHPWLGRLTRAVDTFSYRESNQEGGMCTFTINFLESGEVTYPTAQVATSQQTVSAAEALEQTAIEVFTETFSVDGLPEFARENAATVANDIVSSLEGALSSVGNILNNPAGSVTNVLGDLINDPLALANRLMGLFTKSGAVINSANRILLGYSDLDSLNFIRAFSTLNAISLFDRAEVASNLTPTRTRMAVNQQALNTLTRQALLVQAAGTTALMPLPVFEDAVNLRSETLAALDAESLDADDATYLALTDLRAKVHTDMTSRIQSAARLRDVTPNEVQPALVLAYELYESVAREGEIIARNKLRHPGFVPATPIKVLAS